MIYYRNTAFTLPRLRAAVRAVVNAPMARGLHPIRINGASELGSTQGWRSIVPQMLIDEAILLRKAFIPHSSTRKRFQYGPFTLECDGSHHLSEILESLPNFGRNLADVVNALEIPEPRVIDVGANIGNTAIMLARFVPGVKVLCIEGDVHFMSDLATNTAQISGVTIVEAVLSDRNERVSGEFVVEHGTAHVALGKGHVLELRTLDNVLTAYPTFSYPAVIKIDTDGFDPAILRGARGVLTTSKPVVFYEWHPDCYAAAGEDDTSHADFLMGLGYDGFVFFTNRGEPLLHVRRPGNDILKSLARFSRARRSVDNCHFDVAAFPTEHLDAWQRLGS
jgi:FkbM family methyltransferase